MRQCTLLPAWSRLESFCVLFCSADEKMAESRSTFMFIPAIHAWAFGWAWSGFPHPPTVVAAMLEPCPNLYRSTGFLMTTATCFIRQVAPECCPASSEMGLWSQPSWVACAGSAFEAAPRQEVRISASWGWTFSWLMEQPVCLSAGRGCYRKGRVFTAHCPWQQSKADCHPGFFSSRSGLDCFTSRLHFPFLFLKIENVYLNRFLGKGGAEHWSWMGTFLKVLN